MSRFILLLTIVSLVQGCSHLQQDQNTAILDRQIEMQNVRQELLAEPEAMEKRTAEELESLGDSYLRKGNIGRAYLYYLDALKQKPEKISLLHKQAALLLSKQKGMEASLVYKQILLLHPGDPLALEGLGRADFLQNKFDEAKENLNKAIALQPELWRAYDCLGLIFSRNGKYPEAIAQFNKALQYQPEKVSVLNNLAATEYLAGNFQETIRILSNLPSTPTDPKVYNNLALAYFRTGQYEKALDLFKQGTKVEAIAYFNMGSAYYQAGKYREAVDAYKTAIERNPRYYVEAEKALDETLVRLQKAGVEVKSEK